MNKIVFITLLFIFASLCNWGMFALIEGSAYPYEWMSTSYSNSYPSISRGIWLMVQLSILGFYIAGIVHNSKTKILSILLLFSVSASAQSKYHEKPIVDETFISIDNKKAFKVKTANDKVYNYLFDKYGRIYTNIKYVYKKDRAGVYWEKIFTFPINVYDSVIQQLEYKFL